VVVAGRRIFAFAESSRPRVEPVAISNQGVRPMRARIAGVLLFAGVAQGCTQGTCCATARYSAESRASAPAPVVVRRNAPTWPTATRESASVPVPVASRTVAPQPIVMSSRPEAPPATRARSTAEIAARLRPVNATCPVMLGTPVDGSVTTSYNGRVIAFADTSSRAKWLGDPDRYARNLPAGAGFGSASDGPVFAASSTARAYPDSRVSPPRVSAPLASPELPPLAMPSTPAPLPPIARSLIEDPLAAPIPSDDAGPHAGHNPHALHGGHAH
jgi:hypothetical protein